MRFSLQFDEICVRPLWKKRVGGRLRFHFREHQFIGQWQRGSVQLGTANHEYFGGFSHRVKCSAQAVCALGANGQTLLQNYIAGTDPNNPNDRFTVDITSGNPTRLVSFLARRMWLTIAVPA